MNEELLNINHYMKLFLGLIAMVEPFAASTAFVAMAAPFAARQQALMAAVSALAMLIMMMLFLGLGTAILDFFAISQGAFVTMGGIVLLLTGISMLRDAGTGEADAVADGRSWVSVAIVPLAIPLLAGPGAISTIIVFSGEHDDPGHQLVIAIVILAVVAVTYAFLRAGRLVARLVGKTGLDVFNKIMGMIVLAIAVEFLYDGFALHFPGFVTIHD
jgi:multiple antibiotic resistance protein